MTRHGVQRSTGRKECELSSIKRRLINCLKHSFLLNNTRISGLVPIAQEIQCVHYMKTNWSVLFMEIVVVTPKTIRNTVRAQNAETTLNVKTGRNTG
jgi:hypothetical protein